MKRHLFIIFLLLSTSSFSQRAYYWVGGITGAWSSSSSWNTTRGGGGVARTTPNTSDTLIFDGRNVSTGGNASSGVAASPTDLVSETIAYLIIISNEAGSSPGRVITVTLPTGNQTLTVTNDLLISYSAVLIDGGNTIRVGGNVSSGTFNANSTVTSSTPHSGTGKLILNGTNTTSNSVTSIAVTAGGTSYTTVPTVTIGKLWTASTPLSTSEQVFYNPTDNITRGSLYTVIQGGTTGTTPPTTKIGGDITDGTTILRWAGFAAKATATLSGTTVSSIAINTPGSGYTSAPSITIAGTTGSGATATALVNPNTYFLIAAGNIELSANANYTITSSSNQTFNGTLTLNNGANFILNSRSIIFGGSSNVGGDVTGAGTFAGPGTITIQGTGNPTVGTFNFNTTSAARSTLTNFTINRASATAIIGTCFNNTLAITGLLSLTNGSVSTNSNTVVLKSTATSTAAIGIVGASASITGNVTVERFIASNNRKKYVLVSSPVNSPTIASAWQEGGANTSGYGTQITGATTGNGFDASSGSGLASIFTYDDGQLGGSKWVGLTNTDVNTLGAGKGYLLFVRGDRTITPASASTGNTTLRATGTVTVGNFPLTLLNSGASKFNLIANPYPAPMSWTALKAANANIAGFFYFYDPINQSFITSDGTTLSAPSQQQANVIQSGQAFFVQNSATNTAVAFTESMKNTVASTAAGNTVFNENKPQAKLSVNVFRVDGSLADGSVALFANGFSKAVGSEDAYKMDNFGENIFLVNNANRLSIEGRPSLAANDTLVLGMGNFANKQYTLQISANGFDAANALLIDKYTNTVTAIDPTATTNYAFTVTNDEASFTTGRFVIALSKASSIASVADNAAGTFSVQLSPNPVSNRLNVRFATATTENTTINMVNSLGQVVKTINAGKLANGNINIEMGDLSAGVYTVQLISGGKAAASQKIVKK